jgi:hypothetical protein
MNSGTLSGSFSIAMPLTHSWPVAPQAQHGLLALMSTNTHSDKGPAHFIHVSFKSLALTQLDTGPFLLPGKV